MSKSPAPASPPLRATRAALNRPAPPPSSPAPLPCCRRRGLPEARAALQDGSGGTSRSFRGGFRERGSCTKKLRRRVTQRRRGAPNPATRWADPAIPWLDLRGAALHRLGRRRPLRRPVWSSGTADCPARGRGLGRASAVWLRAALAGGVRPLEVVSCGGQRVPGGGVVLQLGRRVVRTVTTAVGCSLCVYAMEAWLGLRQPGRATLEGSFCSGGVVPRPRCHLIGVAMAVMPAPAPCACIKVGLLWAKALASFMLAEWRRRPWMSSSLWRASFRSYDFAARGLWVKTLSSFWTSDDGAIGSFPPWRHRL
jgi:hypothetical protein